MLLSYELLYYCAQNLPSSNLLEINVLNIEIYIKNFRITKSKGKLCYMSCR